MAPGSRVSAEHVEIGLRVALWRHVDRAAPRARLERAPLALRAGVAVGRRAQKPASQFAATPVTLPFAQKTQ